MPKLENILAMLPAVEETPALPTPTPEVPVRNISPLVVEIEELVTPSNNTPWLVFDPPPDPPPVPVTLTGPVPVWLIAIVLPPLGDKCTP